MQNFGEAGLRKQTTSNTKNITPISPPLKAKL